jgi:hypothetical protein
VGRQTHGALAMPLSPDEVRAIIDRHRWQPGQRDAVLAEVAERKAERESSGEHEQPDVVVRKARPIEAAQPEAAMTQPTDAWIDYIRRQLDKRERSMSGAIADLLGPIEKQHKAALYELRVELAALKGELAELRAEAKVRGALDDVQARLDMLETPPRLKTVS